MLVKVSLKTEEITQMCHRFIHFCRGETLLIRLSSFGEIPLLGIFIKPLSCWNFLWDLRCKMWFHKMIINFQNPTVENFYWNIFIKKVFLPWYLPKPGQLSLISCQINYWPRSKNWKIFLSRLSKILQNFMYFSQILWFEFSSKTGSIFSGSQY